MENSIKHLKILLDDYKFNPETIANYLSLKVNDVYAITNKNLSVFADAKKQNETMKKIEGLYTLVTSDVSSRIKHGIENLLEYYQFDVNTLANISDVDVKEIQNFLNGSKAMKKSSELKLSSAIALLMVELSKGEK